MVARRWRTLVVFVIAAVLIWVAAIAVYIYSNNRRPTAEKVLSFVDDTDLSKLSAKERADAIRKLAEMLNGLSAEERRRARLDRAGLRWFGVMTEEEKASFIDQTMPTGFKQMLSAFEQMPEEKRRKAIDDSLRRLREARQQMAQASTMGGNMRPMDTNSPPISEDLQARIRAIGLNTFYSQSSAQTKAELAPVLEELQQIMESGRPFHQHGR